ncbi:THUMP-like domain-containing protein [Aestuariivivens sediminis]|uniref:class I SAM-dependent methyltransferase n=1 Tax=Aestuariivivens sediminis TaxID=2913557 RepID=UPI001F572E7F|nr:class I SAM-dependent methyltransferase [Aestuariivivens sediminis]
MNKSILNIDIQEFINKNINSDMTTLALKGSSFESVETKALIEQIEAKRKCEKKLPTWYNCDQIYYPNKLHIEQTSSEITAAYKSRLIDGQSLIDITGGFGVDCYYFATGFEEVIHCEINEELSEIVAHNFKQLGCSHVKPLTTDGLDYIRKRKAAWDWIFIDPSRRHDTKGKVFFLKDCQPNVPIHLNLLFRHSKHIMIKTSPLLDVSVGISELSHVKAIHVVAVNNEVKELLWILDRDYHGDIAMHAVNLKAAETERFDFNLNEEKLARLSYGQPGTYLYEPHAAILKSGGFKTLSQRLSICKLHPHSHLYTSDTLLEFPGRTFHIETVLPYNKKDFRRLGIKKANVTTRNFPETVEQIRKKLKIQDGGAYYLFFTTDYQNNLIVIITKKPEHGT